LGFEMAGYRIGFGVEKEQLPFQTHRLNFGGRCHRGDVRDVADPRAFVREHGLGKVDVVIGGPPCQGFSRVGRGKIRSLLKDPGYIHDPRNQFYKEFVRFVEAIRPSHFVMENVPDLQYYLDGDEPLLQKALLRFEKLGYAVDWRVLEAHHYGVPQTRRRLFVVGVPMGQEALWPEKTHAGKPVTVWQANCDSQSCSTISHWLIRPQCCSAASAQICNSLLDGVRGTPFSSQDSSKNMPNALFQPLS
ncbi:MAG TPA: DNA (cytosine-5-)-methyltransferase, partial [Rubrobacter sp.]